MEIGWKDKDGKNMKIGYSQELQKQQLKVTEQQLKLNKLLLICIVLLIVMIAIGGIFSYNLVMRIDALNPLEILKAVSCQ